MNTSTITNPFVSRSLQQLEHRVFEFSLDVIDRFSGDLQNLTAAFINLPSKSDWKQWLSGWSNIGYSLLGSPRLIDII